jgi:hypothetical protein
MKVWNPVTGELKQEMIDRTIYHPENAIGAITYDEKRGRIVTCSDRLKFWQVRRIEPSVSLSHQAPVVAALFNQVFYQVVSASSLEVCEVLPWSSRLVVLPLISYSLVLSP